MTDVAWGEGAPSPQDDSGLRWLGRIVFNVRVLRVLGQLLAIAALVIIAVYLNDNYRANIRDQGVRTGWSFLEEPTGFGIAHSDFRPAQPVSDALWVGIRNTALAAVVGIVIANLVGLFVGVVRLSSSWVARKAATLYVEVLRNVPVLLIIIFAGAGLQTLPRIDDARIFGIDQIGRLDNLMVISNRQVSVLSPVTSSRFWAYVALLAVALVAAIVVGRWRTRVSAATGAPDDRALWGGGLLLAVAIGGYFALAGPITWSRPELDGRAVVGGATLNIPYVAVTVALGLYHASHIAEIVRGSIQAVPHGQNEAATAIGLKDLQRLRFVILPQALRIAVPPTINQCLSLTKNTSLGIAVAYSDITALAFRMIGARAPALQMVIILMVVYLAFSLVTSLLLNIVNRRFQLVER
jgi:general L-amino acid transport system permease protein